jgi:uncharacterized protein
MTSTIESVLRSQGPVDLLQRIDAIDMLRGFAIFGMLLVNMMVFSGAGWSEEFTGITDRTAYYVIDIVAGGKFLRLFTFLFGLGFAMQLQRAASNGVRFSSIYGRRILGLFVIGVIHALLISWTDALLAYAILACALVLFWKARPRVILVAAAICLLIPMTFAIVDSHVTTIRQQDPAVAQEMKQAETEQAAAYQEWLEAPNDADYKTMLATRWSFWRYVLTSPDWYASLLGNEFVMFLLGLYVGRRRFFEDIHAYLPSVRRMFPWLLALGAGVTGIGYGLQVAEVVSERWVPLVNLLLTVGAMLLSTAYALVIIRASVSRAWQRYLRPLADAGRMALTNYLMQSVICTFIFFEYGLGLFGQVGPAAGLVLTMGIFAGQVPLSIMWLSRARFGPVEWLWRSATYGRFQTLGRS